MTSTDPASIRRALGAAWIISDYEPPVENPDRKVAPAVVPAVAPSAPSSGPTSASSDTEEAKTAENTEQNAAGKHVLLMPLGPVNRKQEFFWAGFAFLVLGGFLFGFVKPSDGSIWFGCLALLIGSGFCISAGCCGTHHHFHVTNLNVAPAGYRERGAYVSV